MRKKRETKLKKTVSINNKKQGFDWEKQKKNQKEKKKRKKREKEKLRVKERGGMKYREK